MGRRFGRTGFQPACTLVDEALSGAQVVRGVGQRICAYGAAVGRILADRLRTGPAEMTG